MGRRVRRPSPPLNPCWITLEGVEEEEADGGGRRGGMRPLYERPVFSLPRPATLPR